MIINCISQNLNLKADKVDYSNTDNLIKATGKVIFNEENKKIRISAKDILYLKNEQKLLA